MYYIIHDITVDIYIYVCVYGNLFTVIPGSKDRQDFLKNR